MHEMEIGKDAIDADPDKIGILFREMVQMCLWYDVEYFFAPRRF